MKTFDKIESTIFTSAIAQRFAKKVMKLTKAKQTVKEMQSKGKVQGLITMTREKEHLEKEVKKLSAQSKCSHPANRIARFGKVFVCQECSASIDKE